MFAQTNASVLSVSGGGGEGGITIEWHSDIQGPFDKRFYTQTYR